MPFALNQTFADGQQKRKLSFQTPAPEGYDYIARNHPLVDNLCQLLLAQAMDNNENNRVARCSVIRTSAIQQRTTVVLLRVRDVMTSPAV